MTSLSELLNEVIVNHHPNIDADFIEVSDEDFNTDDIKKKIDNYHNYIEETRHRAALYRAKVDEYLAKAHTQDALARSIESRLMYHMESRGLNELRGSDVSVKRITRIASTVQINPEFACMAAASHPKFPTLIRHKQSEEIFEWDKKAIKDMIDSGETCEVAKLVNSKAYIKWNIS